MFYNNYYNNNRNYYPQRNNNMSSFDFRDLFDACQTSKSRSNLYNYHDNGYDNDNDDDYYTYNRNKQQQQQQYKQQQQYQQYLQQKQQTTFNPTINAYDKRDSIVIEAKLPGVLKEDIHVEFKNNKLIISGEKKQKQQQVEEQKEQQQQEPIETPTIEEYDEETNTYTIIYEKGQYIDGRNNSNNQLKAKVLQKQQQKQKEQNETTTYGPFTKVLDLSQKLAYLRMDSIKATFEDDILVINIPKKTYSSNPYRVFL
ncbi:hypothetical protein CYY_004043 [Polysphondylium violaceum]|uniref:SHSP domain-containing protein n=1 Tax=Polysphondylium violaceum TaxID=133409 RepID=A0A8J4PV81_9MYCE|nr:hypothetical protein CYY_004043 [Polysphondylium violaceum]